MSAQKCSIPSQHGVPAAVHGVKGGFWHAQGHLSSVSVSKPFETSAMTIPPLLCPPPPPPTPAAWRFQTSLGPAGPSCCWTADPD